MYYYHLRLYRIADVDIAIVEDELRRLGEFIKHRASLNRDISYYTLTFVKKNEVNGYIILGGRERDKIERELEIIMGFIESGFKSIVVKPVKSIKSKEALPIPLSRNFFE
ncbi:MAG: hypothetical protein B6U89_01340 [Desulfurococcales archaeon ex4484_58]|nr:MAG: hypothetical protein B6U89_01340 [Desulfurococcales archaeon ex4484_58]